MDWKLDNIMNWKFVYQLTKTYECGVKVTKFQYLNNIQVFKILSDEHIEDYSTVDMMEFINIEQQPSEDEAECDIENDAVSVNDVQGMCLGCNITTNTMRLDVYVCNEAYKGIETVFYFNPHNLATHNDYDNDEESQQLTPTWNFWSIFDEYF